MVILEIKVTPESKANNHLFYSLGYIQMLVSSVVVMNDNGG